MAMKSEVTIECNWQNGRTVLEKAYCTPPFKIANITEDKKDPCLHLMLMNSSPGVLDKDDYRIAINIGESSSLKLETQSYQRIYKMKGFARQGFNLNMEKNSSFFYLPHPVVPHTASNFVSRNRLNLSSGCTLCWGEVLTSGRQLQGETFLFTKYHCVTDIYKENQLIVRENLLLMPHLTDVQSIGQLEGFTHQATLFYINDNLTPENLQQVHHLLQREENVEYGCTMLPCKGIMVRIIGYSGEQLFACLKNISVQLEKRVTHVVYSA
jgi:urease accessory protein